MILSLAISMTSKAARGEDPRITDLVNAYKSCILHRLGLIISLSGACKECFPHASRA